MIKDFKADLNGRLVLVTGAGRGIGKAIALAFAKAGASLAILGKNPERLSNTALELGEISQKPVFYRACDISSESEILNFLAELRANCGSVQILVNNAGIYKSHPVIAHPSKLWQELIDTNLTSAFIFSRELAGAMVEEGFGRIINISSVSGKTAESNASAYSVSKFGMIALTQSLALELSRTAVTVNAICPGWVDTEMAGEQFASSEFKEQNKVVNLSAIQACEEELSEPFFAESSSQISAREIARLSVPQERLIDASEVADLALYLSTQSARGITGQAINVCGGLSL
ncbi:MAG: SDR family oxidoreductase [Candidatus Obscuribacterales bacterium]|nr:SDR family oxidoreductase [Candidatus Obscuribacterales bacterium]